MGLLDELTAHLEQNTAPGVDTGLVNPNAVGAVMGLLQNSGGISGLVQKFEQQGLGPLIQGWISTGPNPPATPGQIQSAVGMGKIEEVAGKLGITPQTAAAFLATALPAMIDKMTPNGSVPQNEHSLLNDALGLLRGGLGSFSKPS